MKLSYVRVGRNNKTGNGSKFLNSDMKSFGKKQLFTLMNKNLTLPFQMIQL